MKALISLTIASTKRYVRNVSTLVFSLFIPLVLIFVFGAFTNQSASKIDIGVVDNAQNESSKQFTTILDKTGAFNIETGNQEDLTDKINSGKKDLVLIIPSEFNNSVKSDVKVLTNVNKRQEAQNATTIISQVLDSTFNYPNLSKKIDTTIETVNSKNLTAIDFLVPGLIAQSIMQLGIFGVAFAFVSQKVTGVLKRILATPIRVYDIIIAEGFARIIISFLQIAILIGVSVAAYNLKVVGNLFAVGVLALMGIIIFQSIGFAIAGYAKDENQVAPLAQVITLPMLLLSGVFFSRDIFPAWLKSITDFFPLTYLADGMREIMNNGSGLDVVGKDFIGLLVWMVISFILAYKLFRWE